MGLEAVYGPATDRQEAIRIIRAAVDNVAWKIYALGRGIEYYDAAAIRAIVRESAEGFRKEMVVVSGTPITRLTCSRAETTATIPAALRRAVTRYHSPESCNGGWNARPNQG